jgi:outer membrane murein-binding lipoprotein Lpp
MEKNMKPQIGLVILMTLAVIIVGCKSKSLRPWGRLKECTQKNTVLSLQVQALEAENAQLAEQVHTLSELDAETRLEALATLDKIRIGKRTGFYDKDDNGTQEMLVVYLEPLDRLQDYVKAVGHAQIQLWDLDSESEETQPVEWTLKAEQLQGMWGGNIFASYYRIKLPVEIVSGQNKQYTLKVSFTDYLSGKTLTDQTVIKSQ